MAFFCPNVYYNYPYAYAWPAYNNQPSFNYNNSSQNNCYACRAGTPCFYHNHAAGQRAIATSFYPNRNMCFNPCLNTGVVGSSSFANQLSATRHYNNQRYIDYLRST